MFYNKSDVAINFNVNYHQYESFRSMNWTAALGLKAQLVTVTKDLKCFSKNIECIIKHTANNLKV